MESSKYPGRNNQCPPIMTSRAQIWSRIIYNNDPWYQGWLHPPRLQSGTFNIHKVWLFGWWVLESLLLMLEIQNLAHLSRSPYDDIHIKNPYISVKWSHIFTKFSGLVPEGPPNFRYMVDGTHLLQRVALLMPPMGLTPICPQHISNLFNKVLECFRR